MTTPPIGPDNVYSSQPFQYERSYNAEIGFFILLIIFLGYGSRSITTQCPSAVICLTIQCIISAIFDTWVIGLCFSRIARPDARISTTMFSKTAVICKRDGKRYVIKVFSCGYITVEADCFTIITDLHLLTIGKESVRQNHGIASTLADCHRLLFHFVPLPFRLLLRLRMNYDSLTILTDSVRGSNCRLLASNTISFTTP